MRTTRNRRMSPLKRTAFDTLTSGLTGLATFGALVGTGWAAGAWAHDYQQAEASKARAAAATQRERARWLAEHPVIKLVEKRRAHRTIERTVRVTTSSGATAPGPGGTFSSGGHSGSGAPAPHKPSGGSSGSTKPPGSSSAPPPPPPPPPPPAPSSGS